MKKIPAGLSVKVLQRFLKEDELDELISKYKVNKKAGVGMDRFQNLEKEMTDVEAQALIFWLTDKEGSTTEKEKELGVKPNAVQSKAQKAALKLLFKISESGDLHKIIERYGE